MNPGSAAAVILAVGLLSLAGCGGNDGSADALGTPSYWTAGCGVAQWPLPSCQCDRASECDVGVVARSDDLGDTWTRAYLDAPVGSIAFPTPTDGWAVGPRGVVFRSRDGGESWVAKSDGIDLPEEPIENGILLFGPVRFVDERRGVIVGVGRTNEIIGYFGPNALYRSETFVLHTDDGGETFRPADITGSKSPAAGVISTSVCFTPSGVGLIGGTPVLLTKDAGQRWTNIDDRLEYPQGIAFCEDETLFLASGPNLVRSTDGGETWQTVLDERIPILIGHDITFLSADQGWVVGDDVLRTDDGGVSWLSVGGAISSPFQAYAVDFATPSDGLWTSNGFAGVTHDGGSTWSTLAVVPADEGFFYLRDIAVAGRG